MFDFKRTEHVLTITDNHGSCQNPERALSSLVASMLNFRILVWQIPKHRTTFYCGGIFFWYLSLTEQHTFRFSENRLLKEIIGYRWIELRVVRFFWR